MFSIALFISSERCHPAPPTTPLTLCGKYHNGAFITHARRTSIQTITHLTANIAVLAVHSAHAAIPTATMASGPPESAKSTIPTQQPSPATETARLPRVDAGAMYSVRKLAPSVPSNEG